MARILPMPPSEAATSQLYLRSMDSQEARPIPGTEGAVYSFLLSRRPVDRFFRRRKVEEDLGERRSGGDPRGRRGRIDGASWSSQGMIALRAIAKPAPPASGGRRRRRTAADQTRKMGNTSYRWPDFLPGGKAVLFAAGTTGSTAQVAVHSLPAGTTTKPGQAGHNPATPLPGIWSMRKGQLLMAVPFDPQRLEITGTPVPVVGGNRIFRVLTDPASTAFPTPARWFTFQEDLQANQRKMVWVSRNGTEQPIASPASALRYCPAFSGRTARSWWNIEDQLWLYDLSRDTLTRFTFEGVTMETPAWTPDGKRIAFFIKQGRSTERVLATGRWQRRPGAVDHQSSTPRFQGPGPRMGNFWLSGESIPRRRNDIWVLRMSDHKAQPFLRTPFNGRGADFLPRWTLAGLYFQ